LEVDEKMNKMPLQKALKVIRGYVDTIEKHYPGWCSRTEGIMGACQVVVEKVPEELEKEPTDEAVMQYCWKRNMILISKEQYKALKAGK
jgi:hypothetical protein